jgi:hypothetical protein
VNSPAHCNYTVAETVVTIDVMMRRLDTGRWDSTEPAHLNALAKSLHGSPARFTRIDPVAQKKYNRTWAPDARPTATASRN